jgi:hypothetical protein
MAPNRKRLLRLAGALVIAAAVALLFWSRPSPVERVHRRLGPPRLTEAARGVPIAAPAESTGPAAAADQPPTNARSVTLSGRVLDAGGGFIAGARIRATIYVRLPDDSHEARTVDAMSDADGRYRLGLLPGHHQLRVEADGYAGAAESRLVMGDQSRDFSLQPAARIAGRVVLADTRQPVVGARVSAGPDEAPLEFNSPAVTTDAGGRFVLPSLTPGSYRLVARTDDQLGMLDRTITLKATDAVEDVELVIAPRIVVRGRVTSTGGGAVVQARVRLTPVDRPLRAVSNGWALTDSDGLYVIEGVMPGRYRFAVTAPGHASQSQRIALAASARQDVILDQAAVVTGQVLAADGRPAVRAWVVGTVGPPNLCRDVAAQTTTDADGRFSLPDLGAGELTLKATLNQQAATVGPELLPSRGQKQVTIQLGAGAGVTGVVRWEDGSPVADEPVLTVMDFAEGSRVNIGANTARDGSFTIRGLPPGEISLQVWPRGRATERSEGAGSGRATVTLQPGEQRRGVELIVARR